MARRGNGSGPKLASKSRKAPTGIAGLDQATEGGLPRGRTTLIFGGPGCGKTVLALQTLVNGAQHGHEPGIFVAFEENSVQILENAATFGWDLETLQKKHLFFLNASLRPDVVKAGKFDLNGLLEGLLVKVRELGARRLVFDGIDVLLTLLADPSAERAELQRIHDWLVRHELTGILTAKASGEEPFAEARYAFAAHMADCAIILTRRHQGLVSERDISILKYRGSSFRENRAPFVIGETGIQVAEQQAVHETVIARNERLSTGVPRFDTMLKGGYFRGTVTLITGLPGTAKSSLCGAFVQAACQRRERTLYVSFDEHGDEAVRNFRSIGIDLKPFVASGRLTLVSSLSVSDSAEIQLMRIRSAVSAHRATCVVVDPISALSKSSDAATALGVLSRFVHWAKVSGLTLICTSLTAATNPHEEATQLGVSTLCDTWVHLAYAQKGGERNRSLTIIKSRGTGHSNQVRELLLGDDGITLTDVYEAGGEVFMGTMRWEKENLQRDEERRLESESERRRAELERRRAELDAQRELLLREVALNQMELDDAKRSESERRERLEHRHAQLLRHRLADRSPSSASTRPTPAKGRVVG